MKKKKNWHFLTEAFHPFDILPRLVLIFTSVLGFWFQDYPKDYKKYVNKIIPVDLGKEVRKLEDKRNLDSYDRTTIQFLKAAINFLPTAMEDGADLTNAVFIFAQAGREFVIQAGSGDWEYYFSEQYSGQITGRCIRRPWLKFIWDKVSSTVYRFGSALLSAVGFNTKSFVEWPYPMKCSLNLVIQ